MQTHECRIYQIACKFTTNIWNTQGFDGKNQIYLHFSLIFAFIWACGCSPSFPHGFLRDSGVPRYRDSMVFVYCPVLGLLSLSRARDIRRESLFLLRLLARHLMPGHILLFTPRRYSAEYGLVRRNQILRYFSHKNSNLFAHIIIFSYLCTRFQTKTHQLSSIIYYVYNTNENESKI